MQPANNRPSMPEVCQAAELLAGRGKIGERLPAQDARISGTCGIDSRSARCYTWHINLQAPAGSPRQRWPGSGLRFIHQPPPPGGVPVALRC